MENCNLALSIFSLLSPCLFFAVIFSLVLVVYRYKRGRVIEGASMCRVDLHNGLTCASDIQTSTVIEDSETECEGDTNKTFGLHDSLLNLSIGTTSSSSPMGTRSSWLRSIEKERFLADQSSAPPMDDALANSNCSHELNPSGGNLVLKPSRLTALGNVGEVWRRFRPVSPDYCSDDESELGSFGMMKGLSLRETTTNNCTGTVARKLPCPNGFSRRRKSGPPNGLLKTPFAPPNGFHAHPMRKTVCPPNGFSVHPLRKTVCPPNGFSVHPLRKTICPPNGQEKAKKESAETRWTSKRLCGSGCSLWYCLLASLAFNAVLVAMFFYG